MNFFKKLVLMDLAREGALKADVVLELCTAYEFQVDKTHSWHKSLDWSGNLIKGRMTEKELRGILSRFFMFNEVRNWNFYEHIISMGEKVFSLYQGCLRLRKIPLTDEESSALLDMPEEQFKQLTVPLKEWCVKDLLTYHSAKKISSYCKKFLLSEDMEKHFVMLALNDTPQRNHSNNYERLLTFYIRMQPQAFSSKESFYFLCQKDGLHQIKGILCQRRLEN